jgi:hypothetical protein
VKPITELLKKGNKYVWSDACDEAFKNLKKLLTTSAVLAQPDTDKEFDVYYDASGTGLGGVLMQECQVISYSLRQLKRHEEHYPTHDMECGSYLYRPQKLEVHIHSTRPEHEAMKMARVDQGLRAGSPLPPREGKCRFRCVELQGSLQLLANCTLDWRRV